MSLDRVHISWEAFLACSTHAFSTENEEVMGMLLGDWEDNDAGEHTVARIRNICVLSRSDKKPDRVEISPEQISSASYEADRLSMETKIPTRVIGWYHSHPHITVLPSHIDVGTQGQYQMLDQGFIGLIFSVFHEDANKTGRLSMTAFQSFDASSEHGGSNGVSPPRQPQWRRRPVSCTIDSPPVVVTEDESKEAGFSVSTPLHDGLKQVVDLQQILFQEERQAYRKAMGNGTPSGSSTAQNPLRTTHSAGVYQQALCGLLDTAAGPLVQVLTDKLDSLQTQTLSELAKENEALRACLTPAQLAQVPPVPIPSTTSRDSSSSSRSSSSSSRSRSSSPSLNRASSSLRKPALSGSKLKAAASKARLGSRHSSVQTPTLSFNPTKPPTRHELLCYAGAGAPLLRTESSKLRGTKESEYVFSLQRQHDLRGSSWHVHWGDKNVPVYGMEVRDAEQHRFAFLSEDSHTGDILVRAHDVETYNLWMLGVAEVLF